MRRQSTLRVVHDLADVYSAAVPWMTALPKDFTGLKLNGHG
jgi:hypothetical protein